MNEHPIPVYAHDISGLPRECPECKIVAHYDIKGRKEQDVNCPLCGIVFQVQKYRRGERPNVLDKSPEDC